MIAVLLLYLGTCDTVVCALSDQAEDLQAFHHSGQTFLTWDEVEPERAGQVRYRVYRSSQPVTDVSGLGPLAEVSQDSAYNPRASSRRVEGRRTRLRIRPGEDVPPGRGLFVYTVPDSGQSYYAVTAVVDGVETSTLSSNRLTAPIQEDIALPEPIPQGRFRTTSGLEAERYVHFVNANPTPLLPAMANSHDTRLTHFNFIVYNSNPSASLPQPLILGFHGGNGIFTEALQPAGDPDEILVGFDDPHPPAGYPPAVNTLWFGFAANLGEGSPLESGEVEPYTLRRIRYIAKWLERRYRIDRDRIYCAGTSFGAIGSLMYGLSFPGEIAAMWLNLPRYDFRADGPERIAGEDGAMIPAWDIERGGASPISSRFQVLFGTPSESLPTPREGTEMFQSLGDGLSVYDRVNFRRIVELHPDTDFPPMLIYHGKLDNVTGWHEKPLMMKALAENHQSFQMYFITSGHRFDPPNDFFARVHARSNLYRYSRTRAVLAFSDASNDSDMGDGLDMVRCAQSSAQANLDMGLTASFVGRCLESPERFVQGERQGTINGYLTWNPDDLLDISDRFEVSISVVPAAPDGEATATVAVRRLQSLRHVPGQRFFVENLDLASGAPLQDPIETEADSLGRLIISGVRFHKAGSRLRIATRP